MTRRIPLTRPVTDEDELREVASVLRSGLLTQGPKVLEFERAIEDRLGVGYAIATSSATTALHLALAALDIGPGDEVLVPDYTFPATANVVIQLGARPVLVDIDPSTFTISLADLAEKVSPSSRAIVPVHAFGLAAEMGPITTLARDHDLLVVEDAACALGAMYMGKPAGTLGVAGCFSFHPRKSITTGEGGMVVTDDRPLAERLRVLRSHGGTRVGGRFSFDVPGFNYRLSDIAAAVGVAQVRKLASLLAGRAAVASAYQRLLEHDERVGLPFTPDWGTHTYQSFVVLLSSYIDRDTVIERMASDGIETTIGTYSLHLEPYFQNELGYSDGDLPNSREVFGRALTLPLYAEMGEDDISYVVDRLQAAIGSPKDAASS